MCTKHGGIGEAEPGSHDRVIFEGCEPARAAVLPRGKQLRREGLAGARGAVHSAGTERAGGTGNFANGVDVEVVRPPGAPSGTTAGYANGSPQNAPTSAARSQAFAFACRPGTSVPG